MRRIAFLLATVIIFSCFSLCAFAENGAPVFAEISDIRDGQVVVSIYGESIKKLVVFNVRVQYDTEVFCYKDGYAAFTLDEDGNTIDNFSGLWVFGELVDGSGCTGAFVSSSGTSRSGRVKICEFVLGVTGKRVSSADITVNLTELVTEDDNYENDIYSLQTINSASLSVEYEDLFEFETTSEGVNITQCYYDAFCVDIPAVLSGASVTALSLSSPVRAPFIYIPGSITAVAEGVLSNETFTICPENSYAHKYLTEKGLSAFTYKGVTPVTQSNVFIADDFMINDLSALFGGDAQRCITSSHNNYYGTGSEITLINGESTLPLSLSVMGDVNGDSVCDVLDVAMCEKAMNCNLSLQSFETISTDFDSDGDISVTDYSVIVNKSLA